MPIYSLAPLQLSLAITQLLIFFFVAPLCAQQPLLLIVLACTNASALAFFLLWSHSAQAERWIKQELCSLLEPSNDPALLQFARLADTFEDLKSRRDELEQEQTLICEFADNALLVVGKEQTVACTNQSFMRIWGVAPSVVSGEPAASLFLASEHSKLKALLDRARESRTPETEELQAHSSVFQQLYVKLTVEWSDTMQAYFCIASDISERRMIENIKHEYAAMLTHDLRSPVSALKLTLENLKDGLHGELTAEAETSLNSGMIGLSQLSNLIAKLILLDQSESGELKLEQRMYPLSDIIEDAMSLLKPLSEARGVRLHSTIDDWIVWCDKNAILQVFTNIIANAIRYSPGGETILITGTVRLRELEAEIADRGPGISDANKAIIFQRYKSISPARQNESTGLGLAVAKAIVAAHGGKIGVRDNKGGGGAAFFFTLGLATEEEIG